MLGSFVCLKRFCLFERLFLLLNTPFATGMELSMCLSDLNTYRPDDYHPSGHRVIDVPVGKWKESDIKDLFTQSS